MKDTLTNFLSIKHPIIQAPMAGGSTTPTLISAVSNTGGLGSMGAAYTEPNILKDTIEAIRSKTTRPFMVNLFTPHTAQSNLEDQQILCDAIHQVFNLNIKPVDPPYIPNFDDQISVLPFPIQNKLTAQIRNLKKGDPAFMSLWSGQNGYMCQDISVTELINRLLKN